MQHLRRVSAVSTTVNRQKLPLTTFWNLPESSRTFDFSPVSASRTFCRRSFGGEAHAAIDHRALLQENEFHKLADSTIHHLLEKLEEFGDNVDIDGFDVDYGNEVLTLKD